MEMNLVCMLLSCSKSRLTNDKIWKHEGFVYIYEVQAQPQKIKEWFIWVGDGIFLCDIMTGRMKEVLNAIRFISISVDEVTIIDNNMVVAE